MDKVDNMQEVVDNVSRKMKILRKNQKERLGIKSTTSEMKNVFENAKERISEF
jgi:hypothetical protein